MTLNRRHFFRSAAGAATVATLPLAVSPVLAGVPKTGIKEVLPMARLRVGRFEVTCLSDGYIDFPFELFTGATPDQVEAAAASVHAARPTGIRSGFTVWLVRDGDRLILVDTGPAGVVSPTSGKLPKALAALGLAPSDIDAVIITHMHVDHISGLVAGGGRAFPGAELYLDGRDLAFFTNNAEASRAPDILASSFQKAGEVATAYPGLQRFEGAETITPGIATVDLAGHTPDHVGVRIEDGEDSLILAADALFHPAAHPALPGLGIVFEHDKAAADAMRAAFFPAAAEEGVLLAATHMPFPGLGRIVKDEGRLAWLPADWDLGA